MAGSGSDAEDEGRDDHARTSIRSGSSQTARLKGGPGLPQHGGLALSGRYGISTRSLFSLTRRIVEKSLAAPAPRRRASPSRKGRPIALAVGREGDLAPSPPMYQKGRPCRLVAAAATPPAAAPIALGRRRAAAAQRPNRRVVRSTASRSRLPLPASISPLPTSPRDVCAKSRPARPPLRGDEFPSSPVGDQPPRQSPSYCPQNRQLLL